MTQEQQILRADEIAGFRYALIAELTNPNLAREEKQRLIREKASRQYIIPYSQKTTITATTIRNWLRSFNARGREGLKPQTRRDKGSPRSLQRTDTDTIIGFLEENVDISAKEAAKKLYRQGLITKIPTRSALSRLVQNHNLTRKERMRKSPDATKDRRKYNFRFPLECVQADVMHAFPIPDGKGKKRKALLLAFLDDASRRILYSTFIFSEKAIEFEKGIKHILLSHGRPERFYTDNGATFTHSQTKRILASLGIQNIHTPPYTPQGKGKIERFFRTVREQFLRPLDKEKVESIEQLNTLLRTWVEADYHRNPHRGLEGQTPLEYWLSKTDYIVPVDRTLDLERLFHHQVKRKIYADATFTHNGIVYEVPPMMIGQSPIIFVDPQRNYLPVMLLWNGREYTDIRRVDAYANTHIKRDVNSRDMVDDTSTAPSTVLSASKITISGEEETE